MIYIFEREQESIHIECSYSHATQTYQIVCRFADGTTSRETFDGELAFRSRLDEIRTELELQAWRSAAPHLLSGAWKV
jgi:hypothetical protein